MSEKMTNVVLIIVGMLVAGLLAWGFITLATSDHQPSRRGGKYRHRTPATVPVSTTTVDANVKTAQ